MKTSTSYLFISICVTSLLLVPTTSCALTTKQPDLGSHMTLQQYQQQGWKIGTVTFLNFEGGFYGIVTDNNEKLLPVNLPKSLLLEGTKLALKGEVMQGMASTQQWGEVFKISDYKVLSMGKESAKKPEIGNNYQ
ncbi:hypothetical protein DXX93_00855 [Thalassotalea euphylliae]|uniref:Uncharacterized protein n=1 Tax=Thalassotalea euphylliae TaxID=1655234 RepID=A0A3E0TL10_9GAMM|nr:hypothetical protein [Thalassotalea euphylliae]REL25249.1 hypothetical protein DXX93_00855 [Thalassotalea euphylliae]